MTPARAEQGWALVAVLWAMTMLALMAAATEALTVTSYRTEQHAIVEAQAQSALDAAVVRAALGIADIRPEARWRVDGTPRRFVFENVPIAISIQDEYGRIDLNAASVSLIGQLLIGSGVPPDTVSVLTDRIVAWRSTIGPNTLHGGSDDDYRAAGLSYGPRHGPFQTVDELKLVLGMTPDLFARIRPALTVYSKRASLDSSSAPREALAALYPGDPGKINQILQAREGDPNAVPGIGAMPGTLTAASLAGRSFSVTAETTTGNRTFKRIAVLEFTGDDSAPYFVLAWQ